MNVWKSWAESKGLNDDIVKYEAKELDECLSHFFVEIRQSDGSDYEPDSLTVMLAALGRHLKHINNSKISIAKDWEFVKCRQVLKGKARALRKQMQQKHLPFKVSQNSPPVLSRFAHSVQPYSDCSLPNRTVCGPWYASFSNMIFSLNKIRPKTKVYDSILISTLSHDEVSAFPLLYKARYSSLLTGRSICLSWIVEFCGSVKFIVKFT